MLNGKTKVIERTGGITIYWGDETVYDIFEELRNELTEWSTKKDWKTKRTIRTVKARYYIDDYPNRELRFHSEFSDTVMNILRIHPKYHEFDIETLEPQHGTYAEMPRKDGRNPRGRQDEYVEFISDQTKHIRILPAFMGVGKTACSLFSWSNLNVKIASILAPALVDNWKRAIGDFLDIDVEDPNVVRYVAGSDELIDYMNDLINGVNPWKIVIFSLNTMQGYITNYKEKDYPLTPDELFARGEFGVKNVDEAHRCMHFHMLLDMYSNIATHQFLTATLMREDKFLSDMENALFKMENRCEVDPPTNHVTLKTYAYRFRQKAPPHLGAMGYQHSKLETNIFKRKTVRDPYMLMLARIFYQDFMTKDRQEGDRALIYFATVNMVKEFAKFLKKKMPDLKIITYLAGDSEEKFEGADVIVSTTKKAGTGTDIPKLTYVLQTIPISSIGENYQNVGRLRLIDGRATTFSYIWSPSITKHGEYHRKRLKDLIPLTKERINIQLNFTV